MNCFIFVNIDESMTKVMEKRSNRSQKCQQRVDTPSMNKSYFQKNNKTWPTEINESGQSYLIIINRRRWALNYENNLILKTFGH